MLASPCCAVLLYGSSALTRNDHILYIKDGADQRCSALLLVLHVAHDLTYSRCIISIKVDLFPIFHNRLHAVMDAIFNCSIREQKRAPFGIQQNLYFEVLVESQNFCEVDVILLYDI